MSIFGILKMNYKSTVNVLCQYLVYESLQLMSHANIWNIEYASLQLMSYANI